MDKNKKTIVEEALLDAKRIQEAIQSNTKEILRSVAREEIDGLVKESLNEADFEEEDAESEITDTEISNEGHCLYFGCPNWTNFTTRNYPAYKALQTPQKGHFAVSGAAFH